MKRKMERFRRTLSELHAQLKPAYIKQFETEAAKHVAGIRFGATEEFLLDARDKGLLLYHHGPEIRVFPATYFFQQELTGNEHVFFEYVKDEQAHHLVGSVDPHKRFRFIQLDTYQGNGYRRVAVAKYKGIIEEVTRILQEINHPT
jgi:hypothetical protein